MPGITSIYFGKLNYCFDSSLTNTVDVFEKGYVSSSALRCYSPAHRLKPFVELKGALE